MAQTELRGKPKAAMLANVMAVLSAAEHVRTRADHLPGLAVAYGPSGYGKSVAAAVLATHVNAGYVECRGSWTKRDLIEAIALELGVRPGKTVSKTAEAVGHELAATQRLLIIDEADILVDRGQIELVRELHMASGAPVMLIGEEALPAKLRKHERVHNRVLIWAPMQAPTLDDARALAAMFVQTEVADDLLGLLLDRARGSVRRIVVNLDRVQTEAVRAGVDTATRAWWGDREIYTGEAPSRRVAQ